MTHVIPEASAIIETHQDVSSKEAYEKLSSIALSYQKNAIHIAYYGWRVERDELWKGVGYDSLEDYVDSLQIPRQSWNTYVQVGKIMDFSDIPLVVIEKIPFGNALKMLRIPIELRADFDWIGEAMSLNQKDFGALLDMRLKKIASDAVPTEKVMFSVPMWPHQAAAIRKTLAEFKEQFKLGSVGQALAVLTEHSRKALKMEAAIKYALEAVPESCEDARGRLREALETSGGLDESQS